MNMYFIALVAPEEINTQVVKWKQLMFDRFNCSVALRSPAHITLIPPFWMRPELEISLQNAVEDFNNKQNSFPLTLEGFSFFKPRVIFVNIHENISLLQLQQELTKYLLDKDTFPLKIDERPFHPHMTIATRDLYKKSFYEAWEIFKNKKYSAEWIVGGISMLRHNKKNWDVIYTSQFTR